MKHGLKRPIQAYILPSLWLGMTCYLSSVNSLVSGQWFFRVAALFWFGALVGMIIKGNYFEVVDDKFYINDSVFRKRSIELNDIERIDIAPGLSSSSKIVLKDKTEIKYIDIQTDGQALKKFMEQFHIPVN